MAVPRSKSKKAKKKGPGPRPIVERILVWSGIVILLLLVGMEWMSQRGYQSTLAALEDIQGSGKQVSLADAQALVRGWTIKKDEFFQEQPVKSYRWRSFFKTYKIGLVHNNDQKLSYVETFDQQRAPQQPKASAVVVNAPVNLPRTGLPAGSGQMVALKNNDFLPHRGLSIGFGLLIREMYRQGLLIAARNELGLATIDEALDESGSQSESPETFPFEMLVQTGESRAFGARGFQTMIEVSRPNRNGRGFNWSSTPFDLESKDAIPKILEHAESLSRKDFVDALKLAGYQKANTSTAVLGVAADAAIDRMDFVSQFSLLRQTDSQIRASGETPERLGLLVRGYANLGNLTDFHWSCSSKIFKARSMLYAQRLIAKSGSTPVALAHRAYAFALAGCHALAIDDVQKATQLATDGSRVPEWLSLINAYCTYQPEEVEKASGRMSELGLYLRMRMCDPFFDSIETLQAVRRLQSVAPNCSRAIELISETGGLGSRQFAVYQAWPQFWPGTYVQISGLANLPAEARDVAKQLLASPRGGDPATETPATIAGLSPAAQASRLSLQQVLHRADESQSDRVEPSWSILAQALRESSFIEAWRTLQFEKQTLGTNADNTLNAIKPMVSGHPFQQFLDCYSSQPEGSSASMRNLVQTINESLLDAYAVPIVTQIGQFVDRQTMSITLPKLMRRSDSMFEDFARLYMVLQNEPPMPGMYYVSPHWPRSVGIIIASDWKVAEPHAADWEKRYSKHRSVMLAFAEYYQKHQRSTDAERCLSIVNELNPSFKTYIELADTLLQRGDDEKAQETLEKALDLPDIGLQQAAIYQRLAQLFATKGDWRRAKPYAEVAAKSFSQWGLEIAARCEEGLGNWSSAEAYHRALSERYEPAAAKWYFWCARLNRGDMNAARELAKAYFRAVGTPRGFDPKRDFVIDSVLDKNPAQALKWNREIYDEFNETFSGVHAALLADELKQPDLRDSILETIRTTKDPDFEFLDLINLYQLVLQNNEPNDWDDHEFELLAARTRRPLVTGIYFAAGKFLLQHGDPQRGTRYLEAAATSLDVGVPSLLANVELRARNVSVGKTRGFVWPDDLAPLATLLRQSKLDLIGGRVEDAAAAVGKILEQKPDFLPGLIARGKLNEMREKFGDAIADYRKALEIDSGYCVAHNNLAWLLSSCERDEVRNGAEALNHAQAAYDRRAAKTWITYGALAAAYAECGDFKKAVEYQKQAQQIGASHLGVSNRLTLFENGKPFRRSLTVAPPPIGSTVQPKDPMQRFGVWSLE